MFCVDRFLIKTHFVIGWWNCFHFKFSRLVLKDDTFWETAKACVIEMDPFFSAMTEWVLTNLKNSNYCTQKVNWHFFILRRVLCQWGNSFINLGRSSCEAKIFFFFLVFFSFLEMMVWSPPFVLFICELRALKILSKFEMFWKGFSTTNSPIASLHITSSQVRGSLASVLTPVY